MKKTSHIEVIGIAQIVLVCFVPTAPAANFNLLYSFAGGPADGTVPVAGLTEVGNVLYGMTAQGGADGLGTIFAYNLASGTESLLHSFAGTPGDGQVPADSFVQSDANPAILYATTSGGGSVGAGAIIALDTTTGAESVVYSFGTVGGLGIAPDGTPAVSGNMIYGMAGNIFSYNLTTGVATPLYSLTGNTGRNNSVILVGDTLYGLTVRGGNGPVGNRDGTIFSYNLDTETFNILHSFTGAPDGDSPAASLTLCGTTLYGTTTLGGTDGGLGTIFSYSIATGDYQTLFSFDGADGANPEGAPLVDGTTLYGIAGDGGGEGCVYALNLLTDTETILHTFDGADGEPGQDNSLTLVGSTLYGMTYLGGANNDGVIFSIAIPEPATFSILAATGACLLLRRRRQLR